MNITDRLREMRAELHVNELRHSGTREGNIYSRWGATVALALIEIESLRAISDAAAATALKARVAIAEQTEASTERGEASNNPLSRSQ